MLFILHMSPPCVSFCFITHQIRLQYLPRGSDLQAGERQIDLVNKPDKFSPLNRIDLSVRRSLSFICSFENTTPAARAEQEPQVIRLNDSADRSRYRRFSSNNDGSVEQKYIYFNSKVTQKCHRGHHRETKCSEGGQQRVGRAGRRE